MGTMTVWIPSGVIPCVVAISVAAAAMTHMNTIMIRTVVAPPILMSGVIRFRIGVAEEQRKRRRKHRKRQLIS